MKKLIKTISRWRSNFALSFALTFGAVAASDYVWTRYISAIADGSAFTSANWSVVVITLGAYTIISYVGNPRLIIAAALGAWVGTYYGIV